MDDDLARRLQTWVDGYLQAWNSNDPAEIGALFTQDAAYYTEPYSPPWQGRDEIVGRWLDRKDAPGESEFRWHPLAVNPDVAVVQGVAVYRTPPRAYSNLWVIRLDAEGRCTEFTEWWMQHPDSDSPPSATSQRLRPTPP
jgi:ketosteroid isomerase-like protein